MRLYLAVAVLVLAFVAYAEAQEESFEDKLSRFGEQVSEIGKNLAEKAKTTFQELHNSEFAANTRNWFEDQFTKLKAKFGEVTQ